MQILADENVPGAVVRGLRERHDVKWILEDAPGSPDRIVLALAQADSRVLLTFDKDFGELAFKAKLPATSGIILVRADAKTPEQIAELVTRAVSSRDDWVGRFSVIENATVRMTDLPSIS